jgi:NADH dehydrogenase [ubiquinone] 1 alpha subcomplex assembly factor 6
VVFDVATLAHQHYEKALALKVKIPKEARISFLPAVSTQRFLERLRRVNFSLTDKRLGKRDHLLPFALYWKKLVGI